MKTPTRSTKAPAKEKNSLPGAFNETGKSDPDTSAQDGRQDVRQQTPRVNVPRQSKRPAERSNQRRSRP